jgi:hypothetical protein
VGALLAGDDDGVAPVDQDLADPAAVLADPAFGEVVDPAEPVCVIFGLVLGLMPARQAREVVAGYADLLAPGSLLVVSCARVDDEALWKRLTEAYTAADIDNHSPGDVEGFLAGLELVPPGLVAAQNWRGGWHDVPAARRDLRTRSALPRASRCQAQPGNGIASGSHLWCTAGSFPASV